MKPLIGIPTRAITRDAILFYATPSTYTNALERAGGLADWQPAKADSKHPNISAFEDRLQDVRGPGRPRSSLAVFEATATSPWKQGARVGAGLISPPPWRANQMLQEFPRRWRRR